MDRTLRLTCHVCFGLLIAAAVLGGARTAYAAGADTPPSAQDTMARVEATAQAEHKKILLSFGASWCGNCHLFNHFVRDPAIAPILDKAFVITEVITGERPNDTQHANSPGGQALESSLGGADAGWPYVVMLDAKGHRIADSWRPTKGNSRGANIGYPASPEEIAWFLEMLRKAAPQLSVQEITTIQTWLSAHAPKG